MRKFTTILLKLKWLGLIGLVGTVTDNLYIKLFWLFFLLGFIEIFSNITAFYQSILQIISYPYMLIKYREGLPNKDNNACMTEYILPFEGTWLVANGGVDRKLSHSWGIWPQRYAYDFLIIDDDEKTHESDGKQLNNYYCYGKNILAPADGEVIKAVDKYRNSNVYGDGSVECKAKDIRGNYLIIKHNENEYSTFAHILPDSITVVAGQKVRRGQVIAKCGNSGNTSEPHIHFQLNDGKSFFSSAGLPIKFKKVEIKENGKTSIDEYIHRGQSVNNC